jgi:hypothetical protein
MKALALVLFLAFPALAVNFYFTVENPPFDFADGSEHGILVLVRAGDGAMVCATGEGTAQVCGIAIEDGYGYAAVRLNIGDGAVTNISVALRDELKSIDHPRPGTPY